MPGRIAQGLRLGERRHLVGTRFFGENSFPSGEHRPGSGTTCAAGRALQHRFNQILHGIDRGELRFLDVAAECFFQLAQQLNALHGVKSKVKIQVEVRPHLRGLGARCVAHDL